MKSNSIFYNFYDILIYFYGKPHKVISTQGVVSWISNKKIKKYQYVVPSTWNLGPRCANKKRGPVEEALIGTPVADAKRPLEILRTVHSFDPCIACGVHVIDPESNQVYDIKVC